MSQCCDNNPVINVQTIQTTVETQGKPGANLTVVGVTTDSNNNTIVTLSDTTVLTIPPGANGWYPIPSIVADGERRVMQITYAGGSGTPPLGGFIGTTGIVATPALAIDIRGAQGTNGWTPLFTTEVITPTKTVLKIIGYTGGVGTAPTLPTNPYLGPLGYTNATNATNIRGNDGAGGSGISLSVQDEGIMEDTTTATLNFVGAGVTANQTSPGVVEINIPGGSSGEVNTASNLGGGTGVFAQKTGVNLEFKSIVAGSNISVTQTPTEVTVNSTAMGFTEATVQDSADVLDLSGVPQASLSDTRGYSPNRLRDFLVGLLNRSNTWLQQQIFSLGINIGNLGASALRRNLSVLPTGDVVATPELVVESTVTAPLLTNNNVNRVQYGINFIHSSPTSETSLINLPNTSGTGNRVLETDSGGNWSALNNLTNIAWVSSTGSDSTGSVGRRDRPYATLAAANSALTTLGIIVVVNSQITVGSSLNLGNNTIILDNGIITLLTGVTITGLASSSINGKGGFIFNNSSRLVGFSSVDVDSFSLIGTTVAVVNNISLLKLNTLSGSMINTAISLLTNCRRIVIERVSLTGIRDGSGFINSSDYVSIGELSYSTDAVSYSGTTNPLIENVYDLNIGRVSSTTIETKIFCTTGQNTVINTFDILNGKSRILISAGTVFGASLSGTPLNINVNLGSGSPNLELRPNTKVGVNQTVEVKAECVNNIFTPSDNTANNTNSRLKFDIRRVTGISSNIIQGFSETFEFNNVTFSSPLIIQPTLTTANSKVIFYGDNRFLTTTGNVIEMGSGISDFYNYGNIYTRSTTANPFRVNGVSIFNNTVNRTPGWYVSGGIATLETNGLPSRGIYAEQSNLI